MVVNTQNPQILSAGRELTQLDVEHSSSDSVSEAAAIPAQFVQHVINKRHCHRDTNTSMMEQVAYQTTCPNSDRAVGREDKSISQDEAMAFNKAVALSDPVDIHMVCFHRFV